jgi:hypothetical protein
MSDIREKQKLLVRRILEGDGTVSQSLRTAAFNNGGATEPLSRLVAEHAYRIDDGDFQAAKASGLTEDQIFEIVVCAAVGSASRHYETALAALKLTTEKG